YTWEFNHTPSEGYLAYLISGDYWHYETMMMMSAMDFLALDDSTGVGLNRLLVGETRGTAWALRHYAQSMAIYPEGDAVAADYQPLFLNNINPWKPVKDSLNGVGIGYLYEYNASLYDVGTIAPWQQHFLIQSMGMGSDLEPLADMTAYNDVRDWLYRGPVGIL